MTNKQLSNLRKARERNDILNLMGMAVYQPSLKSHMKLNKVIRREYRDRIKQNKQ